MATQLKKQVTREFERWSGDGCSGKDSKRPLVVTLDPAGFISLRLKGLRDCYDIEVGAVYAMAVKRKAKIERNRHV